MTIYNLGSINIDNFYRVAHLPVPGETLSAISHGQGLGGKGANQSVAVALAGSRCVHIGAVGEDGQWCVAQLADFGVDIENVLTINAPTAHANICVDPSAENMIVLFSGANVQQTKDRIEDALTDAKPTDILVLQNETNCTIDAAKRAREIGMYVIYSAAPFSVDAVLPMLDFCDLLVLNEVEAAQLSDAKGCDVTQLNVPNILITRGAQGAVWHKTSGATISVEAYPVAPVDTTGAGDCFIGYVAAGLDQGLETEAAMQLGSAASAIQVTRPGTADAIPTRAEVDTFLMDHEK